MAPKLIKPAAKAVKVTKETMDEKIIEEVVVVDEKPKVPKVEVKVEAESDDDDTEVEEVDSDSDSESDSVSDEEEPPKPKAKVQVEDSDDSDSDADSDSDSDSEADEEPEPPKPKAEKPKVKAEKKPKVAKSDSGSGSDSDGGSEGSKRTRGATSSAVSKAILDKMFDVHGDALSSFKKKDVKAITDLFVKTMVSMVMAGDKVTLTNHMSFKRALRKERDHKVPSKIKGESGKVVHKDAHYVMTMEVKPALKAKFEEIEVAAVEKPVKSEKARKEKK